MKKYVYSLVGLLVLATGVWGVVKLLTGKAKQEETKCQ